jgi:hypothetical protein
MLKRTSIIAALVGLVGMMISASCNPPLTSAPILVTSFVPTVTDSISTDPPTSSTAIISTETPALITCPWIAYSDGESTPSLSNENCLNDLQGIGISGNAKQISFSVHSSSSLGTYGVCQDISKKDNLKFKVTVQDTIVSARFLIMIGPGPVPTKQMSRGFRIQPEILKHGEKEIWVKFIDYVLNDFEEDKASIQAIPYWNHNGSWNFDFDLQFNGPAVYVSMNKKALSPTWPLNSSNRYLCFAYQQMPTADNAAELKAKVEFP